MYWPLIGGFVVFVLFAVFMGWLMDPSRRRDGVSRRPVAARSGGGSASRAAASARLGPRPDHSAPAVSVAPCTRIEQNTTSAARLKITGPPAIPWLSTSSENVMVATPLGPNHDMNARVAVSVRVPASAVNTATGRAISSVTATTPTAAHPEPNRPRQREQRPRTRRRSRA